MLRNFCTTILLNKLQIFIFLIIFVMLLHTGFAFPSKNRPAARLPARFQINIGPCTWIIDRKCPDNDISFYLYTRNNRKDRQHLYVDDSLETSNLSDTFFDPSHPVKIIVHGYNSDMFLTPLIQMKEEYLDRGDYNLIFVDWSLLAPSPCYPAAAQNTRHAGKCIAQLINRIKETGAENIHIIGFSLGAHVANFVANNLKNFKIPRITGLDPALPLFITASQQDKLDQSDARFVDVIHTNALIQGKIEQCGHADFYMNGGIIQSGCLQSDSNPVACSHHRAPDYFTESIKSERGFYGWKCSSYINFLLGMCPRTNDLHLAGEDCRLSTKGMFLVTTNNVSPYAAGQWTNSMSYTKSNYRHRDPFEEQIDEWGKLEGGFNYVPGHKIPTIQESDGDWPQLNRIETIISNFDKVDDVDDQLRLEKIESTTMRSTRSTTTTRTTTERWRQNDRYIFTKLPFNLIDLNLTHYKATNENFSLPKIIFDES